MERWDATHSLNFRGAYKRVGKNELYVRTAFKHTDIADADRAGHLWFVDGIKMGCESDEPHARAAAEASLRAMSRTHTRRVAASA